MALPIQPRTGKIAIIKASNTKRIVRGYDKVGKHGCCGDGEAPELERTALRPSTAIPHIKRFDIGEPYIRSRMRIFD